MSTSEVAESLTQVPVRYLIASDENARQQEHFAKKFDADYRLVPETSHRSILGFRRHASEVAAVIMEAIDATH
jgi:hypothetical protein